MRVIALLVALYVCAASAQWNWYIQSPTNASADRPLPRYHHGVAHVGSNYTDSIVVVGGFDFIGDGVFLNDTWVFHTSNNTWRFVNSSSYTNLTNRAYFTANTYRWEVVVFGGHDQNEKMYNDVWRFRGLQWHQDTYSNESVNPQLLYRQYHAAAVVNHTLWVFGGHSRAYGRTTNELLAYNLTSHTWTLVAADGGPGPSGRQGHTLHAWTDPVYGDSLILFGGYSDYPYTGGYNDAWQYVISQNKWYTFGNFGAPAGRSGHASALIANTLLIQGGYAVQNIDKPPTSDVYFGDTWALSLNGGGASKWIQLTADSSTGIGRRQGHEIAVVNNTMYSVGGYQQYVGLDINVWAFQNLDN